MGRGPNITPATRERVHYLRHAKYSTYAIAEICGISRRSVERILSRPQDLGVHGLLQPLPPGSEFDNTVSINGMSEANWDARYNMSMDSPPKALVGDLSDEQIAALRDFETFADRYFGERLYPHQREWITHMMSNDFSMLLCAPRHGKTHLVSVLLPVWLLSGGGYSHSYYDFPDNPLRNNQIFLVSKSEDQARKNFMAIEARLTNNLKLIKDFGRFRHSHLPWVVSRGALITDGRQRDTLSGDYSLVCIGANTAVLGRGATWILVDDVADLKNTTTDEAAAKLTQWLRAEIFTRREKVEGDRQARVFVVGARLPLANDLYRQLEELKVHDDEEAQPLFATKVQPAVLDWTTETVLCPERMTFRGLMQQRALVSPQVFEAMYQQNPAAAGFSFCQPSWVHGTDNYPGCLDTTRRIGELPTPDDEAYLWLKGTPSVRVLSIDPSPTQWTAATLMDIPRLPGRTYAPILLDLARARFNARELMNLIEDWWATYHYRVLIFEANAAQRFLLQVDQFQVFQRRARLRVISHQTTGVNKPDPDYGVQTLAGDVEAGNIRIPWGDPAARDTFKPLVRELLSETTTDDCLLSLWFPKWHLPGLSIAAGINGFPGYPGRRAPVTPPPRLVPVPKAS